MTGVNGPVDPSHVHGQSIQPIQEKKQEAGMIDILSQLQGSDIAAFLQAAGLTKTEAEGIIQANSSLTAAKPVGSTGKAGALDVADANNPRLPASENKEDHLVALLGPDGSANKNATVGDKRAAAWLSGSFATVYLMFLLELMQAVSLIKRNEALAGAEGTIRASDITNMGAEAIVDVSKQEAEKHIIQRNAAIARAAIAFASFVGQTVIKPIVSAVVSNVKSLCAQGVQKIKQGISTAYNKVKYEMAKNKFQEADAKAKALESNEKFHEDSPAGEALRAEHAQATTDRDAAFKQMEKYAVKSGNGDDFKQFAATNQPDPSKNNPEFSQGKADQKLKDATQANEFRNEAKGLTDEQKQLKISKINSDLKGADGVSPASKQEKIAHNEGALNAAQAKKQEAMEQGAHAQAVVSQRDELQGKSNAIQAKLDAGKNEDGTALSQTQRQELVAKQEVLNSKVSELNSRIEANHYLRGEGDKLGVIAQSQQKVTEANQDIQGAQENLNKLHAYSDSDAQFASYMSGKENAIFGDPRPGSDQIAGMAGSKAYGEYIESKIPPGSSPDQAKVIREKAGADLEKQKDLRLNESAENHKALNARVDKGVAEFKADRKAAMQKAKDSSSYDKEMHNLAESGRHASDFGQNLVTAVEHSLLARAELALGHLKAIEHILRELGGNVRNWNDKTHESYREACELIKNIIDAMAKIFEAEKQRGFGKTFTQ